MDNVVIDLEYCYGIKKLKHEFCFSDKSGCVVYSSNGTMKTSLAKTLKDISEKRDPKDMIFPNRASYCSITTEQGFLQPEQIFVIDSYNEAYRSQKETLLLANNELKGKYERVYQYIDEKQRELLNELKKNAGFTTNLEMELTAVFNQQPKDFLELLASLENNVVNDEYDICSLLSDYKYKDLFNDKVDDFFKKPETVESINQYMEKYNQLLEKSTYLKKGVFNHTNANAVGKSLHDNGFFNAEHKVILAGNTEIKTQKELDALIQAEKEKILTDQELKKLFDKIDIALNKNREMKSFLKLLEEWPEVVNEYKDIKAFKQKVWICYLQKSQEEYSRLLTVYKDSKIELKDIFDRATAERTAWEEVIQVFNRRFTVPFELSISNQEDVILKADSPVICFSYRDKDDVISIKRDELISVLSMGERRALYLLSIIFDIEARKRNSEETLLIIDDIADSFDYKNKYAIIEYLNDNLATNCFKMIILTHNFDFYRTVGNRLDTGRNHCFMTIKTNKGIQIVSGGYLKNVFDNWKKSLHKKESILIASIPFARNLLEYIKGSEDRDYKTLTKLLHIMTDTKEIKVHEIEELFKLNGISSNPFSFPSDSIVLDMIYKSADKIEKQEEETINLENKIVLSIAIRLKAEEYMICKINNQALVDAIRENQTMELFKLFKSNITSEERIIKTLEEVILMTPENIHINAFMYEPLLDLSDDYLKKLYKNVKSL